MDVSPKTIREVEFREKLRGYNPDEVDEFLERVAAGLEILLERLRQATERAVRAEQRATEVGEGDDAMRRTLVLAQRTADAAVQEAKDQAAQFLGQAEAQAQAVRAEAAEHAHRTIEDATREAAAQVSRLEEVRESLRGEIATLQGFVETERARMRSMLQDALRRVDDVLPSPAVPPAPRAVDLDLVHTEPPPAPEEVDTGPPTMAVTDDDFFAELRMAVNDTSPLGPRDEGV
jgi:cell division initiation protein